MNLKYFLTHFFLLKTIKAIGKLRGNAHKRLKLFLHMAWLVPNHIKINSTPINPSVRKKLKSNRLNAFTHEVDLEILKSKINRNRALNKTIGIKMAIGFAEADSVSRIFFSATRG